MVACSSISWSLMQNNAFSVEKPYPFEFLFYISVAQWRKSCNFAVREGQDSKI